MNFLEQATGIACAHRGGAKEAPENSWQAFTNAYRLGYRWIETDVQVTAEGEVVLFHDRTLRRTAHRAEYPANLDLETLTSLLDEVVPERGGVVRLVDLLEEFPDVAVNVDPKHDAAVFPLIRLVQRTGSQQRVCIGSFSHRRILAVRATFGDQVVTSLTPREVASLSGSALRGRLRRRRGRHTVQVPATIGQVRFVRPALVEAAHAAGWPLHVWTVDEAAEMHELLGQGVDGIMTDRPTLLKSVLLERGLWA